VQRDFGAAFYKAVFHSARDNWLLRNVVKSHLDDVSPAGGFNLYAATGAVRHKPDRP
jgi:hypothetical protein